MDIHFGRVVIEKGKVKIRPIDNNQQSEDKLITLYEEDARKMYRNGIISNTLVKRLKKKEYRERHMSLASGDLRSIRRNA